MQIDISVYSVNNYSELKDKTNGEKIESKVYSDYSILFRKYPTWTLSSVF